jgi:hypothetical protein
MGCHWDHLPNKIIDTNCIARGLKYGVSFKKTDDLLEYQYKIYHTRRKDVKSSLTFLGKENGIEKANEELLMIEYHPMHNEDVESDNNCEIIAFQRDIRLLNVLFLMYTRRLSLLN